MIVSSTEIQNNFGKYLRLSAKEDIIITRNGMEIARLLNMEGDPAATIQEGGVKESAGAHHFKGRKATYEEFLELTRNEEYIRYEYIDGEIYMLASPRIGHQYAITKLVGIFINHFNGSKCTPFTAPCDIKFKRKNSEKPCVVQPDLMVICDLDDHLNERDYYTGVPALVVEVLSESTRSKDMVTKLDLYMDCGVKEYWVVNPENDSITIYEFKDYEVKNTNTYKNDEAATSFHFEGLAVEVGKIFKSSS